MISAAVSEILGRLGRSRRPLVAILVAGILLGGGVLSDWLTGSVSAQLRLRGGDSTLLLDSFATSRSPFQGPKKLLVSANWWQGGSSTSAAGKYFQPIPTATLIHGDRLWVGLDDGSYTVLDLRTKQRLTMGKLPRRMRGPHQDAIRSFDISVDGKTIVSGGFDGRVVLWDAATEKAKTSWQLPQPEKTDKTKSAAWVHAVVCDRQTASCFVGCSDGRLLRYSATGEVEWQVQEKSAVRCLAIEPKGKWLAAGCSDGSVCIFTTAEGKLMKRLTGHKGAVMSVSCSPYGRLASGGEDRRVRSWNPKNWEMTMMLQTAEGPIHRVIALPKLIVSGSADGRLQFWDPQRRLATSRLLGHVEAISSLSVRVGDKPVLVSASIDGSIRSWSARQ